MSSYINNRPLEELFADVESRPDPVVRVEMIRGLEQEFARLALDSFERIAYDLGERGWTVPQIANELGVSRNYIARMGGAYAKRRGFLSPFRTTRDYSHAVDISGAVRREVRQRVAESPHPSEGTPPA